MTALLPAYGIAAYLWSLFTVCAYESSDRGWHQYDAPFKGATFDGVVRSFDSYMSDKQMLSIELCRTSEKNWLNPFLWPDYAWGRRWQLIYIPPTPWNALHKQNLENININIQSGKGE